MNATRVYHVRVGELTIQVRVGEPWIAFGWDDQSLDHVHVGNYRTRRQAVRAAGYRGCVEDAREARER